MSLLIERRIVGVSCESTTCGENLALSCDLYNDGALREQLQEHAAALGWCFHLESQRRAYCPVHHDHLFRTCTCRRKHRFACPIHSFDVFITDVVGPEKYLCRHAIPSGKDLVAALLSVTLDRKRISSTELLARLDRVFEFCAECQPGVRELAKRLQELGIASTWDSPRKLRRGYVISHAALEGAFEGSEK